MTKKPKKTYWIAKSPKEIHYPESLTDTRSGARSLMGMKYWTKDELKGWKIVKVKLVEI